MAVMIMANSRTENSMVEQVARFIHQHGGSLTAKECYHAGMRFTDGETTPYRISLALCKLHMSGRYVVERRMVKEGRTRAASVRVIEVRDLKPVVTHSPGFEVDKVWMSLITRKHGQQISL
jgi:hypothetical protein